MAYQPGGIPFAVSVAAARWAYRAMPCTASAPAHRRWSRHRSPARAANGITHSEAAGGRDGPVVRSATSPTTATAPTLARGRRAASTVRTAANREPQDPDEGDLSGAHRETREGAEVEERPGPAPVLEPGEDGSGEGAGVQERDDGHDRPDRPQCREQDAAPGLPSSRPGHDGEGEEDDGTGQPAEHAEPGEDAGRVRPVTAPRPHGARRERDRHEGRGEQDGERDHG